MRGTVAERFNAKIGPRTEAGCLLWIGARGKAGHGQLLVDGKLVNAQRVAWELAFGPIPPGLHVLHHCDVPPCVEPSHLFVGTHADNMADMRAKGRWTPQRGESNGRCKLSDAQVVELRALWVAGHPQKELAKRFGVSPPFVSRLVRGQRR